MFPEKIRAVFMRGGTSKALIFQPQDLPDRSLWDALFLSLMGSPDPYIRQLNGMGGGVSSLSKIAVIEKSLQANADIDYTFGQVQINESKVDFSGNCGNISSAVGPYAVQEGLVKAAEGENIVRIFNTNTKKIIHSVFEVKNGAPLVHGDLEIPGVAGKGAPIRLDFLDPGGATTGNLFPTGNAIDQLDIPNFGKFEVTMIDAANACVFVNAEQLGLTGIELPFELEQMPDQLELLGLIRIHASVKMGISRSLEEAKSIKTVPYVGFISAKKDSKILNGQLIPSSEIDFIARALSNGQAHLALPLTVSLCLGVAASIDGTIVSNLNSKNLLLDAINTFKIGMPSGILTVGAQVHKDKGEWAVDKGSFYRTARRLFDGFVYSG